MTESTADLIKRLTRLIDEELAAQHIAFVLVVGIPRDEGVQIGLTANLPPADALHMLTKLVENFTASEDIRLLDEGNHSPGHA